METIRCNVCGAEVDKDTINCPYCGCSVKGDGSSNVVYNAEEPAEETEEVTSSFEEKAEAACVNGAKAFKWLMILGVIRRLEALSNFLTGNIYRDANTTAEVAYAYYGNSLKYLDTFYEIAMAILIVTAIMGIIALSIFNATSSYWVVGTYAGTIVATLAMLTGRTVIFGVNNFDTVSLIGLGISTFVLVVLISFFKKTKHIFVN